METINYCITLPQGVNINAEERTADWYKLYDIISDIIQDKVYNDGVVRDICSRDLSWEGENLIFSYKAVPATAASMSSYPYYHALIITEGQLVIGE